MLKLFFDPPARNTAHFPLSLLESMPAGEDSSGFGKFSLVTWPILSQVFTTHNHVWNVTHLRAKCRRIWHLTITYWKRLRMWAGTGTKSETVTAALEEYIKGRKQYEILYLFRAIDYELSYDYKSERKNRMWSGIPLQICRPCP